MGGGQVRGRGGQDGEHARSAKVHRGHLDLCRGADERWGTGLGLMIWAQQHRGGEDSTKPQTAAHTLSVKRLHTVTQRLA